MYKGSGSDDESRARRRNRDKARWQPSRADQRVTPRVEMEIAESNVDEEKWDECEARSGKCVG